MTPTELALPSGRSVTIVLNDGSETLQVTAPGGGLELSVTFGPHGATLRLGAGRVEVAADELSLACRSLDVSATGAVTVRAEEFRVKTDKSVHLNGETVRLNCPPAAALSRPEA